MLLMQFHSDGRLSSFVFGIRNWILLGQALPSGTQFAFLRGVSPIGGGWIEEGRA